MTTRSENLIHIKMEYGESLETRKDVLGSEREVLRLLQTIKKYHDLRKMENALKLKLEKKIKDLKLNITKMEQILPKIKIPEILMKEEEEIREEFTPKISLSSKIKKQEFDKEIEIELKEIQEKLKKLG